MLEKLPDFRWQGAGFAAWLVYGAGAAWLLTRGGRPYAALMPISTPTDLENLKVSSSPGFQAMITQSRRVNPPGSGLTTDEVRRALGNRPARRLRRSR